MRQPKGRHFILLPFAAEGDTFFPEFADQFPLYEILESNPEAEWRRYFETNVSVAALTVTSLTVIV